MRQTHDKITQNLAERLCWEVARQDDARVTRRLLDIERLKAEHGQEHMRRRLLAFDEVWQP